MNCYGKRLYNLPHSPASRNSGDPLLHYHQIKVWYHLSGKGAESLTEVFLPGCWQLPHIAARFHVPESRRRKAAFWPGLTRLPPLHILFPASPEEADSCERKELVRRKDAKNLVIIE